MKRYIFITLITLILNGCSTAYFQLYKTQSNDVITSDNGLIFEQPDIKVIYNFWDNFGNSTFLLYNKTDSTIYVDLSKSHLIINSIAYTYFRNRTFTESASVSLSASSAFTTYYINETSKGDINNSSYRFGDYINSNKKSNFVSNSTGSYITTGGKATNSKSFSVGYQEEKIICIPPKSGKIIDGYFLNKDLVRHCDLFIYPSSKKQKTVSFDKENSPLTIKNVITYSYSEDNKNLKIVSNEFWIEEITNYLEDNFFELRKREYCGEKSISSKRYFKFSSPDKFYLKYIKDYDNEFKH